MGPGPGPQHCVCVLCEYLCVFRELMKFNSVGRLFFYEVGLVAAAPNLRYILICMDTTFTKHTGHPFFHEWTSNQRSGRATNTTRLQIAVRVFLVPSKIRNIASNTSQNQKKTFEMQFPNDVLLILMRF